MVGTLLAGRYRIVERLGAGGTGEVYRADDEQTHESVALKLLRPSAVRDLTHATKILEDAWTANLIRHPNIVVVHETGLSELGPFIVMEDLRGSDLTRILERQGRLTVAQALALVEPVLSALGAAHGVGLLHGDVKPENVVVYKTLRHALDVKVLDFGTGHIDGICRHFIGTTEYLSPEQASLKPLDPRSDVFSVCVLLYELLTNTVPFRGPTASSTAYRIVNLPCPSLAEGGCLHCDALWEVLKRGLEKDPAHRYQSCRELLDALRPWVSTDTPTQTLLSELLPPHAYQPPSGSLLVSSRAITRSASPSSRPEPESGARQATPQRSSQHQSQSRADRARQADSPTFAVRELVPNGPVLPARYRGRYKVRAIVWQALDEYVRARRPSQIRERLLLELPSDEAKELFFGTLQGIVYAELDLVTLYVEQVSKRLFDGEVHWCRAAGREAVDGVLAVALSRSIPPAVSLITTARRICQISAPLFDFGVWRASETADANHVTLTVSDMDPLCTGLRLFFLGLIERSIGVVHGSCNVSVMRGDGPFMPRLIVSVELHANSKPTS